MKEGIHGKWNPEHMEQVSQICSDFKPTQTNADRIRSMSDEELADYLDNNFCHRYCCGEREKEATLDWLQSEAE